MIAHATPEARALLEPVWSVLEGAVARLPWAGPVRVSMGDVDGAWALAGDALVLSAALEGPAPALPGDVAAGSLGLDRWRRAAASVLEAVATRGLPEELVEAGPRWLVEGLGVHVAHAALPEAGAALPERAIARAQACPARHPRSGEAVLAALALLGEDAPAWGRACLATGRIPVRDFCKAGEVILADAPTLPGLGGVAGPPAVDVPAVLSPWSWARVEVPAHPRGGRVRVEGAGGVRPSWGVADQVLRAVAGAGPDGCRLVPDLGGPVGTWEVRSAAAFGRVLGARGLRFRFGGSGRFEVELADAFVGSVDELPVAERVGTSGTAAGRWAVSGPHELRLREVVVSAMTVHGRDAQPFVAPAAGGMGAWIEAMSASAWRWARTGDRLTLSGALFGAPVEIRLAAVP